MEKEPAKAKIKEPAFMRKEAKNEREALHQYIFDMCRRPRMHFHNGLFAEAGAALHGWVLGLYWGDRNHIPEWAKFNN